jgi:hypothetical protein
MVLCLHGQCSCLLFKLNITAHGLLQRHLMTHCKKIGSLSFKYTNNIQHHKAYTLIVLHTVKWYAMLTKSSKPLV